MRLLFLMAGIALSAQARELPPTLVHLFEWNWKDVGTECEHLGHEVPGVGVLVPSPAEHALRTDAPWYERYQLVSYRLESKSGTRQDFATALARCQAAHVPVIVDVVLNHMAAGYDYNFPGLFSPADFHHCNRNGDDRVKNYGDRWEVQNCELAGLPDLDTARSDIQDKQRAFLQDLLNLGATGFRIDAAKHMPAEDLGHVLAGLRPEPALFSEVWDFGNDVIAAREYYPFGSVTALAVPFTLENAFHRGGGVARLASGGFPDYIPGNKRLSFVDNHDLQRGVGQSLSFRERRLSELAHVFLLAWPGGSVEVPSSYEFSTFADGAPNTPACGRGWVCEHRWPWIEAMMRLRGVAEDAPVTRVWSDGPDRVAFGRGNRAFVLINYTPWAYSRSFQTDLAAGSYCNVLSDAPCTQQSAIRVDAQGRFAGNVGANSAVALHINARPR